MARRFKRWKGPWKARRGKTSGSTVVGGRFRAYLQDPDVAEYWVAVQTPGIQKIQRTVVNYWTGGKVLISPGGWAIKPLASDPSTRYVLGKVEVPLKYKTSTGETFDMGNHGVKPGAPWPGPYAGTECVLHSDGSLMSEVNEDDVNYDVDVYPPSPELARAFNVARPTTSAGRVLVTEGGLVLTKREDAWGDWRSCYVGTLDLNRWVMEDSWIVP